MEAYGKILLIAMPVFLALVLFEKWFGWYKKNDTVRPMDMISSLTSGITNVTKDVLGLSVVVISYAWLVNKIAVVHIRQGFLVYVAAFIALILRDIGCIGYPIVTIYFGIIILYTIAVKNLIWPAL